MYEVPVVCAQCFISVGAVCNPTNSTVEGVGKASAGQQGRQAGQVVEPMAKKTKKLLGERNCEIRTGPPPRQWWGRQQWDPLGVEA